MSSRLSITPDIDAPDRETPAPPPLADDSAGTCPRPEAEADQRRAWQEALAARLCLHCRGELDATWRPEDGPFCCRGCRSVHDLIHGSGLSRYYDLQRGRQAPAATLRPAGFAWLDRLLEERGITGERPFRLGLESSPPGKRQGLRVQTHSLILCRP